MDRKQDFYWEGGWGTGQRLALGQGIEMHWGILSLVIPPGPPDLAKSEVNPSIKHASYGNQDSSLQLVSLIKPLMIDGTSCL